LFVGEVMKLSKGKADPKITNELLRKKLDWFVYREGYINSLTDYTDKHRFVIKFLP
jgi:hypothetical protein